MVGRFNKKLSIIIFNSIGKMAVILQILQALRD